MAAKDPSQGGKGSKKFGRNATKSPAMARYRQTNRKQINKAKRIAKHEKAVARAATRKETNTPRGYARAVRRANRCTLLSYEF